MSRNLVRKSAILLLLLAVLACNREPKRQRIVSHLSASMNYADSWSGIGRKGWDAFSTGLTGPNGKRYRALIQKQPGGIAFYYWPDGPATVRFSTYFDRRQKSDLMASIVVEGDYPRSYRKEFSVAEKGEYSFPLEKSEGPLRIIFQARSKNLTRLGGVLYWIDPVIEEYREPPKPEVEAAVQSFRQRQAKKNVLLLLLDAAAYSHFSYSGYFRPTTPNIDRIAREGVIFTNAAAPAPYTMASTGSLLTGLYPYVHGVYEKRTALHESFRTVAEMLRESGWKTALFSANPNVSKGTGYDQGFQHLWDAGTRHRINADEIASALLDWLQEQKQNRFFAYAHFREPHFPYAPPDDLLIKFGGDPSVSVPLFDRRPEPTEDWKQKTLSAYDANLAFADLQVGRVLEFLQSENLMDDTIIIVTADHGEAFWQHGLQGHNSQVYEEMMHIPLLVRFPGEPRLQGARLSQLTGTLDLSPSLADLFRLPLRGTFYNGQSWLPTLFGAPARPRLLLGHTSDQRGHSLRSETLKYVDDNGSRSKELFDLARDPLEQKDVRAQYPITARYFSNMLQKEIDAARATGRRLNQGRQRRAEIDAEMEEQLKALGYIQ